VLKELAARNITHESDRLPALSGLAKFFQSHNAGKHLAGFWKEDILRSLLWSRAGQVVLKRLEDPRAPTWSPFSLVVIEKESIVYSVSDIPIKLLAGDVRRDARLVNVETVAYGNDTTSHVKMCALTLVGCTVPVGHIGSYWNSPYPVFDEEYNFGDEKEDWIYFLVSNYSGSAALVLRPSKKFDRCYERLGVVVRLSDSHSGYFSGWKKAMEVTITIV
jgi:hypothetical protein